MQPLISSTATKLLLSSRPDHVSRVVMKDDSDEECVQVSRGRAYLTQTCQKSPMTSSLEILALDLVGVDKSDGKDIEQCTLLSYKVVLLNTLLTDTVDTKSPAASSADTSE
jgi:hypothetical protein